VIFDATADREDYFAVPVLRLQTDAAFAALRTRPDFQVLMMDLAFPKEAIAPGG
jgi:hypothetical protein